MFPRLRERIGPALIDRIDLMIEFSTLGEYALAEDLRPVALHADSRRPGASVGAPRTRDHCPGRSLSLSRGRDD